jgi:PAS domain-containing protein
MNLQPLIDSIPALIRTGLPDGSLDYFNQTRLNYVGLSLEDLSGWKWTAAIHPEDVAGIVCAMRFRARDPLRGGRDPAGSQPGSSTTATGRERKRGGGRKGGRSGQEQ